MFCIGKDIVDTIKYGVDIDIEITLSDILSLDREVVDQCLFGDCTGSEVGMMLVWSSIFICL